MRVVKREDLLQVMQKWGLGSQPGVRGQKWGPLGHQPNTNGTSPLGRHKPKSTDIAAVHREPTGPLYIPALSQENNYSGGHWGSLSQKPRQASLQDREGGVTVSPHWNLGPPTRAPSWGCQGRTHPSRRGPRTSQNPKTNRLLWPPPPRLASRALGPLPAPGRVSV